MFLGTIRELAMALSKPTQLVILASLIAFLGSCTAKDTSDQGRVLPVRPNILLIMADDLGYSDLGFMGGEIDTPVIDTLAEESVFFSNFYAAPQCGPTRVQLLSGIDNNQSSSMVGSYHLDTRLPTVATILRNSGYETIMAGKWDLGWGDGLTPSERGFDQSFALLPGAADHYNLAEHAGSRFNGEPLQENGEQVRPEGYFSTSSFTDKLVEYLGSRKYPEKPFFVYASYTAPHWPVQAPEELVNRYLETYLGGYQRIAEQRVANLQASGLASIAKQPYLADFSGWENLTEEERLYEARLMAIYAAMTEQMDKQIDRLLKQLEAQGELGNTLIIFLSDNGPDASNNEDVPRVIAESELVDNSYQNLGRPGSYAAYGHDWAEVSSTPLRGVKMQTLEGGIKVPAFILLPDRSGEMTIRSDLAGIKDLAATIYDLAQVPEDQLAYLEGRVVGKSLRPALEGTGVVRDENEALAVHYADRYTGARLGAIMLDGWKLVGMGDRVGPLDWQLYNLNEDPGETNNLADNNPDEFQRIYKAWQEYALSVGL